MNDTPQTWEERFDKALHTFITPAGVNRPDSLAYMNVGALRDFIAAELARVRKETIDEIRRVVRSEIEREHSCERTGDCTDIHIGAREMGADILAALDKLDYNN